LLTQRITYFIPAGFLLRLVFSASVNHRSRLHSAGPLQASLGG
jgi:hypothetical protein